MELPPQERNILSSNAQNAMGTTWPLPTGPSSVLKIDLVQDRLQG